MVCFMFLSVGWLSLMFGSKTRPLWLALLSSTHLSFLTLSSVLNTVTAAVTAAAGVITSIAVTRSFDDAMISCVYRRPPLMHMAIGYRLGWGHFLECIYFTHFPLDWMLRSIKCIEISLSDQTPGAETLSKVCVWTNESSAGSVLCSHWSRHKL